MKIEEKELLLKLMQFHNRVKPTCKTKRELRRKLEVEAKRLGIKE